MLTFLLLLSRLYAMVIFVVFGVTVFSFFLDSNTTSNILNTTYMVASTPFIFMINEVMMPIIKWFIGVPNYFLKDLELEGGVWIFAALISIPFGLVGALTTFLYFIINLILFPIWTIVDPKMVEVWAIYANPFYVSRNAGVPLFVEINNSTNMTSKNKFIRQVAINNDLADRIRGKVATKQDIADMFRD